MLGPHEIPDFSRSVRRLDHTCGDGCLDADGDASLERADDRPCDGGPGPGEVAGERVEEGGYGEGGGEEAEEGVERGWEGGRGGGGGEFGEEEEGEGEEEC